MVARGQTLAGTYNTQSHKGPSAQTQREIIVNIRDSFTVQSLWAMNPRNLKAHVERAIEQSGNENITNIKIASSNRMKSGDLSIKTANSKEVIRSSTAICRKLGPPHRYTGNGTDPNIRRARTRDPHQHARHGQVRRNQDPDLALPDFEPNAASSTRFTYTRVIVTPKLFQCRPYYLYMSTLFVLPIQCAL